MCDYATHLRSATKSQDKSTTVSNHLNCLAFKYPEILVKRIKFHDKIQRRINSDSAAYC
jgi:hypothetical protein